MTGFAPKSGTWREKAAESFARQTAMTTLQAKLVSAEPGDVVIDMPFVSQFAQHHGYMHAGAITTVLDSACGYAAFSLFEDGQSVVTAEFKINFLAPAIGDRFRCIGRVVKPGRTLTICEGRAYAYIGETEKQIALMTATMVPVPEKG